MVAGALVAPSPQPHTPVSHCGEAGSFRQFSSKAWAPSKWRRGSPPRKVLEAKRKRLDRAKGCGYRGQLKARWAKDRLQFGRYRVLRHVAPYPGGGTYWAIPYYIVYCESRGEWTAYNPSGASGPYQLMPEWGAPFPADSWHEEIQTHRIAGDLYAGGAGASNWVCA